jgi:hypothetical protein
MILPPIYRKFDKLTHSDTILYEIYMLRFAAGRLVESMWRDEKDAWVYLESFLLHYRNLLEFFGRENRRPTDLHVTNIWALENLEPPASLNDIPKKGAALLRKYEPTDPDGGGRISQYLQHCTLQRIVFKQWDIPTMCQEIEPLINEVEPRLKGSPEFQKVVPEAVFLKQFSASTAIATIRPNVIFVRKLPG